MANPGVSSSWQSARTFRRGSVARPSGDLADRARLSAAGRRTGRLRGDLSNLSPDRRVTSGIWTRTHNTLPELAAETGLIWRSAFSYFHLAAPGCIIGSIARGPTRDPLPPAVALPLAAGILLSRWSLARELLGY